MGTALQVVIAVGAVVAVSAVAAGVVVARWWRRTPSGTLAAFAPSGPRVRRRLDAMPDAVADAYVTATAAMQGMELLDRVDDTLLLGVRPRSWRVRGGGGQLWEVVAAADPDGRGTQLVISSRPLRSARWFSNRAAFLDTEPMLLAAVMLALPSRRPGRDARAAVEDAHPRAAVPGDALHREAARARHLGRRQRGDGPAVEVPEAGAAARDGESTAVEVPDHATAGRDGDSPRR